MRKEERAVLLRIFIGESDKYDGKPTYQYLLQEFKKLKLAGATVLRGIAGFGKKSYHIQTTSVLRLSSDLPVIIEVVDTEEKIAQIKPLLDKVVKEGLITEEKVTIYFYGSDV